MRSQIIFGMPQHCCNRNCKGMFYRESHLGWLPKSEAEVYAVMQCPKCKDRFAVVQIVSSAHEYYSKLPQTPMTPARDDRPITLAEIQKVRKKLDSDPNILSKLHEGRSKPGTPGYDPEAA